MHLKVYLDYKRYYFRREVSRRKNVNIPIIPGSQIFCQILQLLLFSEETNAFYLALKLWRKLREIEVCSDQLGTSVWTLNVIARNI